MNFFPALDIAFAESESVFEQFSTSMLDLSRMLLGLEVEKQG
jgi:hypothetical protein